MMMLKNAAWLLVCASISACAPTDEAIFSDSANRAGAPARGAAGSSDSSDPPQDPGGQGGDSASGGNSSAAGNSAQGGSQAGTGGVDAGSGEGAEVCGNGVIEGDEACDDGGNEAGDGCTADCEVRCTDFDSGARPGPDGSCYEVRARFATWEGARSNCAASDAHLVTISSAEENKFVGEIVSTRAWLGATDGKDDNEPDTGTYTWITGEPFSYQSWAGNNPNALAYQCAGSLCYEHCAGIDSSGDWKDWPCRGTAAVVCEWDAKGERL